MNDAARPQVAAPLRGDAALIRAVGSFALTAAVINVIVGGGIFRMPPALSAQVGAAAPLALLAGALAIIPIALCFAAVGSRVQVTGGPYSYLERDVRSVRRLHRRRADVDQQLHLQCRRRRGVVGAGRQPRAGAGAAVAARAAAHSRSTPRCSRSMRSG